MHACTWKEPTRRHALAWKYSQDLLAVRWQYFLKNMIIPDKKKKERKKELIRSLTLSHKRQKGLLGSCAFLRWLVWIGVSAKNLNEDKLVPTGAIRQKMNPHCTEVSFSLPSTLSILKPSSTFYHILLFPSPYSLNPSRWMLSSV